MRSALITGVAAFGLNDAERAFYREVRPAGAILFTRNCRDTAQIARLVGEIKDAVQADDFLVLIDQEGGRVQRLRGENGRALPPARRYGDYFARDPDSARAAAHLVARLVAEDLSSLGINCNCAPVLDIPVPGAHDIIGDRAYASDAHTIVTLAREVVKGYIAGGVVPVIKHIPGHGRATADSHLSLPVVGTPREELSRTDFLPFRLLSDAPAAMTAHVLYSDVDRNEPASTSAPVIADVIRGEMGYRGLLMSDDLSMQALSGDIGARAGKVIAAGCDVALHCNGDMGEMRAAAAAVPALDGAALKRFAAACRITRGKRPFDAAQAQELLAIVLAEPPHPAESV